MARTDYRQDFEEATAKSSPWPIVAAILIGLLFIGGVFYVMRDSGPVKKPVERKVTKITLPPPPPPPPPPEQPKPKPLETPKEIVMDTPQDKPPEPKEQQKSPEPAALTSKGPAGNDAFGAVSGDGSVGSRIGGCLGDNCGDGTGGGFKGYTEYEYTMRAVIERALRQDKRVRGVFSVNAKYQVGASGEILSVTLLDSTGDSERDQLIASIIRGLRPDRKVTTIPETASIKASVRKDA
jgi:periplasmic protein TonB